MEHVLKYFDDSLDSWQKFMKNKFNMPWSKIPYEQKIVKQLRDYSKLQDKLLHDDQMFKGVRNFFRKFDKAKQLSTIINASDNTSLRFSNAKEAKDFFDNLKVIGRSSPEILKTLFK
jgi:BioD-like phosphotransacetylase family protein